MNQADRMLPVRHLLEQERYGVLSTLSRKAEGWPFGSLTPFALTEAGQPLVFLSGLAEHTQNLLADPRVSLFVQDSQTLTNPQAGARATLLCIADAVSDTTTAQSVYLQRFPESTSLMQLGDFRFFRLKIERVRFIGGFGEMYWVSGTDF